MYLRFSANSLTTCQNSLGLYGALITLANSLEATGSNLIDISVRKHERINFSNKMILI